LKWLILISKAIGPEPFHEIEDRQLETSNFDPETMSENVLKQQGQTLGEMEFVKTGEMSSDNAYVKCFDLMMLIKCDEHHCDFRIHIGSPSEKIGDLKNVPNTGTIVMFHLSKFATDVSVINRNMAKCQKWYQHPTREDLRESAIARKITNVRKILGPSYQLNSVAPVASARIMISSGRTDWQL
jgi:hypothetical protein